ncbi:MAG: T9SS type A sorting domain-containing protein [Bacteroidetes bacterium]|nr:T9SS type A sorting domain-containing protein [Bacteroidota bacterium]
MMNKTNSRTAEKKQKLIYLIMLFSMLFFSHYANAVAETEPNDTWNQADVITLGATGTGTAGLASNQDWWRVTSALDGKLTVNWTATNSLNIYCQIYDTLGVVQYASAYTNSSNVLNVDGLAAGTYYIKLVAYYGNEAPNYSFVPTWTAPAQLIDVEPNNTKAQAKTLPVNGSRTGHIGYVFNQVDDLEDWWQVTTTANGRIDWTITSHNGQNIYARLYANDGVTLFGGSYTTSTATYSKDGLAPGTYYIKINNFYTTEFAPYTISNNLVQPSQANDVEPNNTKAQAKVLPFNGSKTGHIGYAFNGVRDEFDWWKVTTTLDGRINWTITSHNGQNVYAELYDNNGTTFLGGSYTSSTATYSKDGLAAGTYFIRIKTFYATEFATYTVSNGLVLPPVVNDAEPNGLYTQAIVLPINDSAVGHIGYYYNLQRDEFDWYTFTTVKGGKVAMRMMSLNGQNVYAQLYDNDGITYLGGGYTSSDNTWQIDGLGAGNYFIRVKTFYNTEWAPYKLFVNSIVGPYANDLGFNNTAAAATPKNVNSTFTGNINYYYQNRTDTFDWYKFSLAKDGNLKWTLTSGNSQNVYAELFNADGLTYIIGGYTTTTSTWGFDKLEAGTYYMRVRTFYNSEFAPYSITTAFIEAQGGDNLDNDYANKAKTICGYNPLIGHINYLRNNNTYDPVDWHKFVKSANSGPVSMTVQTLDDTNSVSDGLYIYYTLFLDTAGAPITSEFLINPNTTWTNTYNALANGTYYIRIRTYSVGNNSYWGQYKITANFKDTCSQSIALTSSSLGTTCNKGSLTYYITRGFAPYACQLFRDGVAYGAVVNTSDTAKFTNLPPGNYQLRTKATGASTYNVSSASTLIIPRPAGTSASGITKNKATIKWTALACTDGYVVAFPNPAAENVTVDLSQFEQSNVTVTVYDLSGKIHLQDKTSMLNYQLSIEKLSNGIYTLMATSDNKTAITKLIIAK